MPVKLAPQVRPQPTDYAAYYGKVCVARSRTDILGVLEAQRMLTAQLLAARSSAKETSVRPGKMDSEELVGHIADSERFFVSSVTHFARGQNAHGRVRAGRLRERWRINRPHFSRSGEEFAQVRGATLALF